MKKTSIVSLFAFLVFIPCVLSADLVPVLMWDSLSRSVNYVFKKYFLEFRFILYSLITWLNEKAIGGILLVQSPMSSILRKV